MNILRKYIFFITLFTLYSLGGNAQDIFYSQYLNAPLYHNPSLVGVSEYTTVILNYRSQYIRSGSKYNIPSVSFLHPFYRDNGTKLGGIGLTVVSEDEGNGIINTTGAALSFAYNIPLNRRNLISMGLQPGFFGRKVNTSEMTTDSQYFNGHFDQNADINDVFSDLNASYFSISSGLTWNFLDENGKQISFLGVAMYNINRPVNSFISDLSEVPVSFVTSGGFTLFHQKQLSVTPSFRWIKQKDVDQLNMGGMVKYKVGAQSEDCHIGLGAWYSINHASIFLAEAAYKNFMFGFSYDVSTSQKYEHNPTNNAYEITLAWRKAKKKVVVPKAQPQALVLETPEVHEEVKPVVKKLILGVKGKVSNTQNQQAISGVTIQIYKLGSPKALTTVMANENGEYLFTPDEVTQYSFNVKAPNYQPKTIVLDYHNEDLNVDIQLEPLARNTKIELENIYFETGSFNIAQVSLAELNKLTTYMRENPDINVEIGGHTDNVGSASSNEKLSLNRAKAVYEVVVSKGIDPNRLSYVGYGESQPLVPNNSKANQAKNRRIEFIIK
ncbi:PorP/SprF family type IX secretion system membrane protein [Rapidithrix thailandica]|uniref:PorP/SprF family type IX secretion system membrane protein n=1 Tax=Rapidithrix thailandica TaxID=413964 RepID=A0AAW9RUI7_9BACT